MVEDPRDILRKIMERRRSYYDQMILEGVDQKDAKKKALTLAWHDFKEPAGKGSDAPKQQLLPSDGAAIIPLDRAKELATYAGRAGDFKGIREYSNPPIDSSIYMIATGFSSFTIKYVTQDMFGSPWIGRVSSISTLAIAVAFMPDEHKRSVLIGGALGIALHEFIEYMKKIKFNSGQNSNNDASNIITIEETQVFKFVLIEQEIWFQDQKIDIEKMKVLLQKALDANPMKSVIIFTAERSTTDELDQLVKQAASIYMGKGLPVSYQHEDKLLTYEEYKQSESEEIPEYMYAGINDRYSSIGKFDIGRSDFLKV